jgi:hypothetical protein
MKKNEVKEKVEAIKTLAQKLGFRVTDTVIIDIVANRPQIVQIGEQVPVPPDPYWSIHIALGATLET